MMYIDDNLLQGDTFEECLLAVKKSRELFDALGFTIHPNKSAFIPTCSSTCGCVDCTLFIKRLETAKIAALNENGGNFDASMEITLEIQEDLSWWIDNISKFPSPVARDTPSITVTSDASGSGWGGECNGLSTGGMWTAAEAALHINCLEPKAAQFALKSLCRGLTGQHIKLLTDNTTTVGLYK